MSDRWLPEVEKDRGSFKPEVARPLVQRGMERLSTMASVAVPFREIEVYRESIFLWSHTEDDAKFAIF